MILTPKSGRFFDDVCSFLAVGQRHERRRQDAERLRQRLPRAVIRIPRGQRYVEVDHHH